MVKGAAAGAERGGDTTSIIAVTLLLTGGAITTISNLTTSIIINNIITFVANSNACIHIRTNGIPIAQTTTIAMIATCAHCNGNTNAAISTCVTFCDHIMSMIKIMETRRDDLYACANQCA